MLKYPIVQIAYFVEDAQAAARRMAKLYGAGPFFFGSRIELEWGEVRGKPARFLHSSAYGQWGAMMVELVQQDEEGDSPFRDLYQPGEGGIHHVAMMVDSMEGAYEACSAAGYDIAAKAMTLSGTEFAFVDAVEELGHLIEIYEKNDQLVGFYKMVADASMDWDGRDPVRMMGGGNSN